MNCRHGRHGAYGATVGNLLEAAGYSVDREYYVNDAGVAAGNDIFITETSGGLLAQALDVPDGLICTYGSPGTRAFFCVKTPTESTTNWIRISFLSATSSGSRPGAGSRGGSESIIVSDSSVGGLDSLQ